MYCARALSDGQIIEPLLKAASVVLCGPHDCQCTYSRGLIDTLSVDIMANKPLYFYLSCRCPSTSALLEDWIITLVQFLKPF